MNEEIINIIPEKPELTPAQAYREGVNRAAENEAQVAREASEEAIGEAAAARRKFEASLPQRQDEAMNSVLGSMEASQAEEDAQRAKNIKQAESRGSDVLERTGKGYNPVSETDRRCNNCFIRQQKLENYQLTNYNTSGDRCRTCGSDTVVFQEEMVA